MRPLFVCMSHLSAPRFAKLTVFLIISNIEGIGIAGATQTGSTDDLADLADFAERH